MQEKHLYEYAVIRVVPKVEREEFINVGIILFSKKAKFIDFRYQVDEKKLNVFASDLDLAVLEKALAAFENIARGNKQSGIVAAMDIPERFRWITAVKSTCIQTSRPHPGFAEDLEIETTRLFQELVL